MFRYLVAPAVRRLLEAGLHSRVKSAPIDWLLSTFELLYNALWLFPAYVISLIVNTLWCVCVCVRMTDRNSLPVEAVLTCDKPGQSRDVNLVSTGTPFSDSPQSLLIINFNPRMPRYNEIAERAHQVQQKQSGAVSPPQEPVPFALALGQELYRAALFAVFFLQIMAARLLPWAGVLHTVLRLQARGLLTHRPSIKT